MPALQKSLISTVISAAAVASTALGATPAQMREGQLLSGPNLAAAPGLRMPFVGLGTGDHSPNPESTCGFHCTLTSTWLEMGGRRLDGADSYGDEVGVGLGIVRSKVPRSEVWITSKTGPGGYGFPLGFNDTLIQTDQILKNYSTTWVDLLLIHSPSTPKDPVVPVVDQRCAVGSSAYSATQCRLATWRAMLQLQKEGKAKAVGVSNYQIEHLTEIESAGLTLPAVNQVMTNPQHQEKELQAWCSARGIKLQAYHSLGGYNGAGSPMKLPTIVSIAKAHNVSTAQVILNWQISLNISVNPGFTGPGAPGYEPPATVVAYMKENLGSTAFELTPAEVQQISAIPAA
jgi:2,5-diketo-D-gluconate reductase A